MTRAVSRACPVAGTMSALIIGAVISDGAVRLGYGWRFSVRRV